MFDDACPHDRSLLRETPLVLSYPTRTPTITTTTTTTPQPTPPTSCSIRAACWWWCWWCSQCKHGAQKFDLIAGTSSTWSPTPAGERMFTAVVTAVSTKLRRSKGCHNTPTSTLLDEFGTACDASCRGWRPYLEASHRPLWCLNPCWFGGAR